ncbi:UEV domain-domain-containing protein [Protomyces lactucae-debilis]|uniref:UEV domain-domain-containing protein n=1 Tax=Protomyces lactucae-debilis TaxID=2754530 RepID=A0A1Y2EQ84_PROLT|nr:UEV domain-containing protein [Protomyces lactucae-debilis]ORY73698.1 UEV domain-domain-containing protein [Protomyces lactucae-debilis]
MARVPDQVLAWLRKVLQPEYNEPQRIYEDVAEALHHFPSLRPRTDIYTFADGETRLLLVLNGAIPTQGRGSLLSTPIQLWLPHAYPQAGPIALINPGPGMVVNPSNYVDINRICYHPYLAYWSANKQKHNLRDALLHLQQAFDKEPPLHQLNSTYAASQTKSSIQQAPPRPRKQSTLAEPDPNIEEGGDPLGQLTRPKHSVLPPAPPKPPARLDTPIVALNRPGSSVQSNVATIRHPLEHQRLYGSEGMIRTTIDRKVVNRKPVPFLSDTSTGMQKPNTAGSQASSSNSVRMQLDCLLLDLERKHAQGYRTQTTRIAKAVEGLKEYESNLIQSQATYERTIASCAKNESVLSDRLGKAKGVINEMMLNPQLDIDECLIAQNRVYNQLYELTSEEAAIDDTIYALGRALENERLDLDMFLKHSRTLAREQFMRRALILKITDLLEIDV